MGKERFEDFSKDLPFRLRRVGPAVTERLRAFAQTLELRLKSAAPKRHGFMAKAIKVELDYRDGANAGRIKIRIPDPAANAQEQGGVVRGNPWLAIPLRRELERFSGPRETGNYFVVRMNDGRLFLASGSGGRAEFHYRLKESVFIKKNPFIMKTVTALAPGFRDGLLRDGSKILNPSGRGGPFDPSAGGTMRGRR